MAPALPPDDAGLVRAARPLLELELVFLETVGDPRPVVRGDASAAGAVRAGIDALARHWGLEPSELSQAAAGPPADDLPLALLRAAGQCHLRGRDLDWRRLSPAGARVVRLPRYPWQRRSLWIGHRAEQVELSPESSLEDWIRARLAAVLGSAPAGVDLDEPLERLGLDSLMALELANAAEEEHGVALELETLRRSTPRQIADRVGAAADEGSRFPRAASDPAASLEPFPLTEIQRAYYVGRAEDWELGGVSCHFYREFEHDGLDLERLELAVNAVVERHPMLRAAIESPRSQRVLPEVEPVAIRAVDLSGGKRGADRGGAREAARDAVAPGPSRRPPAAPRAARPEAAEPAHPGRGEPRPDRCRRAELAAVRQRGRPPVRRSGRRARADRLDVPRLRRRRARARALPRYERARAYWLDRLDELPGPPPLPLAAAPAELGRPRFRRLEHLVDDDAWARLAERSRGAGVTPSTALCFAFSEVLAEWSGSSRFTLNLTTSNRLPLHPDVPKLIGDFTALTLLDVDVGDGDSDGSFAEGAARLRERLWTDLGHRMFSGISVLRERAARGGDDAIGMPVVFTSLLGQAPEGAPPPFSCLGDVAYAVSQTPQVWLDHQLVEEPGGVRLSWDAVEGLFDTDALEHAFARYLELVDGLARSDEPWRRPARLAGAGA